MGLPLVRRNGPRLGGRGDNELGWLISIMPDSCACTQPGYWGDSRIQANPSISERWLRQIRDESIWLHGGPELESQLLR